MYGNIEHIIYIHALTPKTSNNNTMYVYDMYCYTVPEKEAQSPGLSDGARDAIIVVIVIVLVCGMVVLVIVLVTIVKKRRHNKQNW